MLAAYIYFLSWVLLHKKDVDNDGASIYFLFSSHYSSHISSLLHAGYIDSFTVDQIVGLLVNLLNSPVHLDLFNDNVRVYGLWRVIRVIHYIEV